jgi:hypothetical protein
MRLSIGRLGDNAGWQGNMSQSEVAAQSCVADLDKGLFLFWLDGQKLPASEDCGSGDLGSQGTKKQESFPEAYKGNEGQI